jgi:hypothetical protein
MNDFGLDYLWNFPVQKYADNFQGTKFFFDIQEKTKILIMYYEVNYEC